jgi:U3 small nucleolar RNA-associated protein 21
MAQSPVVDVIAIGCLDGSINIWNVKQDKRIITYHQEDKVTAISFRTDEEHYMATSSSNGNVSLWDLDNRRLFHIIQSAHNSTVLSCQYLNGQPLLLTSGHDNSIKQWLFEGVNAVPKLLKFRSGHSQAPTSIKFFGPEGFIIVSAARDRSIRYNSIIRDSQSMELSQGHIDKQAKAFGVAPSELKLDTPLGFALNAIKSKEWDCLLSYHADSNTARSWNLENKKLGKHTFSPDNSNVTAVGVSQCGNYGFVGTENGQIVMYNMQSGQERKKFEGHGKQITGLCTDAVSRILISTSSDSTLRFWDTKTGKIVHCMELDSAPMKLLINHESGLCAIACQDFSIRLVDTETKRVIRIFKGHKESITDLVCFIFRIFMF